MLKHVSSSSHARKWHHVNTNKLESTTTANRNGIMHKLNITNAKNEISIGVPLFDNKCEHSTIIAIDYSIWMQLVVGFALKYVRFYVFDVQCVHTLAAPHTTRSHTFSKVFHKDLLFNFTSTSELAGSQQHAHSEHS